MIAIYLFASSPSSLLVDPGTDVFLEADAAPEYDYTVDDQTLAAELARKHPPPLNIPISPILFSLMLALGIATATALHILMHSLIL